MPRAEISVAILDDGRPASGSSASQFEVGLVACLLAARSAGSQAEFREIRQTLILASRGRALSIAQQYCASRGCPSALDDAVQFALLGAIWATDLFDGAPCEFAEFQDRLIRREVKRGMPKVRRHTNLGGRDLQVVDHRERTVSGTTALGLLGSRIRRVLATVRKRDRQVLELRYGLAGFEHSSEQIATYWGVTYERIRSVHSRGLRSLHHPARLKLLEPFLHEEFD